MTRYYEDAKYNAAFDRCVDVMAHLMQKYGYQVLEQHGINVTGKVVEAEEIKTDQISGKKAA